MNYITLFKVNDELVKGFNVYYEVPEYVEHLKVGEIFEFIANVTKQDKNQSIVEHCHVIGKISYITSGVQIGQFTKEYQLRQICVINVDAYNFLVIKEAIEKVKTKFEELNKEDKKKEKSNKEKEND